MVSDGNIVGMARILRPWEWLREKLGIRSVFGAVIAVATFFPDWESRFVWWKEELTEIAQASWFPLALRTLILLVGVGLIVFDVLQRSRKHTHHIKIMGVEAAHLEFHEAGGYYSQATANPSRTRLAYLVNVSNTPALPGKVSKGTGKIRARLKYVFDRTADIVSPVAWCGEFFSFVEIEPGETRQIILALSSTVFEGGVRSWSMVVNRRGNSGDAISMHASQDIPFLQSGTILVELILCETGSLIAQSEIGWEWKNQGMSSGPTYIKHLV